MKNNITYFNIIFKFRNNLWKITCNFSQRFKYFEEPKQCNQNVKSRSASYIYFNSEYIFLTVLIEKLNKKTVLKKQAEERCTYMAPYNKQ